MVSRAQELSRLLGEIGGDAGGTFGDLLKGLSRGIDLYQQLAAASKQYGDAIKAGDYAKAASSAVLAFAAIYTAWIELNKWLESKDRLADMRGVAAEVAKNFGLTLSDQMAAYIAEAGKRSGNSLDAFLRNLDKVIEDQGGVTIRNAQLFAQALFTALTQRGRTGELMLTTQEMFDQIERVFPQIAAVITENGDLASKAILNIIKREEELGLQTQAVSDFIKGQLGSALDGLAGFLATGATAYRTMAEAQQQLADLEAQYAEASGPQREKLAADIEKVTQTILTQAGIIEATGISNQASATAMGAAIAAAFEKLQERGLSVTEALKMIAPAVQALQTQLEATGLSGGEAFDQIRRYTDLANDKIAGPALDAVSKLNQAFLGLFNSGLMNEDMFRGLAGQVAETFDSLVAQGKSSDDVLRLMGPTLQTIWELWKDQGYQIDDATRALLEQGEAAGVVGDKHRSAQERMALAAEKTAEAVTAIARVLGAIPPAAETAANGIQRAIDRLPKRITIPVEFPGEPPDVRERRERGGEDIEGFAAGSFGFRDFGRGTLAMLHGREAVVKEGQPSVAGSGDPFVLAELQHMRRDFPRQIAKAVQDAILLAGRR